MNDTFGKMLHRFINAWLHPWRTMHEVREEGPDASIKFAMIFVVVMTLLSGLIRAILASFQPLPPDFPFGRGAVWSLVILIPLFSFVGSFIGAFFVWAVTDGIINGTKAEYKTAYRIFAVLAAFSPVSALVAGIPGNIIGQFTVGQALALAINIWALAVMVGGVIVVRQTPVVKSVVAWVLVILGGFLLLLTLSAAVATQAPGQGGFGELGLEGDGDLGLGEDLDRELQGLAERAREQERPAQ